MYINNKIPYYIYIYIYLKIFLLLIIINTFCMVYNECKNL